MAKGAGDLSRARELLIRARDLAAAGGRRARDEAALENLLGVVAFAAGELPRARAHQLRAYELALAAGGTDQSPTYMRNLASVCVAEGQPDQALQWLLSAHEENSGDEGFLQETSPQVLAAVIVFLETDGPQSLRDQHLATVGCTFPL